MIIMNLSLRGMKKWNRIIMNLLYGFCCIVVVWMMVQLFVFTSFRIPSDSMEPSVLAGDYILVDKCSKGGRFFNVFDAIDGIVCPDGGSSRGMMCLYSISLIREVGTALSLM